MKEKYPSKSLTITAIFILFLVCISPFVFGQDKDKEPPRPAHLAVPTFSYTPPDVDWVFVVKANYEKAEGVLAEYQTIQDTIDTLEFPTVDVVLTSLGNYYITGYTSIECGGSTITASGATVHKADSSITNPTTCAIDPALHDFGDIFYLEEFGYYVAEDTGSAVKGKHLDLYFHDDEYNYALSITGKYEVFAVEYVYGTELASKYSIKELVALENLGFIFA